ncbi:Protein of unknown function [Gryllus bimaculatus]|nr:Protein of unknown function [Gryllus bimaculatus]
MATEKTDIVAARVIKVDQIKEEPEEKKEDYCWNSIAKDEPKALQHSVKEEDDVDEVLDPPLAVYVQPMEEQQGGCIEETKSTISVVPRLSNACAFVESNQYA